MASDRIKCDGLTLSESVTDNVSLCNLYPLNSQIPNQRRHDLKVHFAYSLALRLLILMAFCIIYIMSSLSLFLSLFGCDQAVRLESL